MPHECGTPRNNLPIADHLRPRELGVLLAQGGYDCIYGGKWHLPQVTMPKDNDHGFRVICRYDDRKLPDACTAAFHEHAAKPAADREPFFMVASFGNPHDICQLGRNMALPFGELDEPAPPPEECPNLPPNFAIPAFEPEILRIEQQANWALWPYRTHSPEDWRQLRWGYYRLVERVDRQIGKILDGLQAAGLDDDTVVLFSSDHGDGHGAHQWNQKCVLYEEVVRVPLILRAPGARAGQVVRDRLVSNGRDLYPTICDYAGVAPPDDLQGLSLRPLAEGREPASWRDALFIETTFDGGRGYDTTGRAVRTERHKYIVYDRGKYREQLFDIQADPGEMVNLAVEARHHDLLAEHRALLHAHTQRTADKFAVPGHWQGRP